MFPELPVMVRRRRRQCLITLTLLVFWLVYKYFSSRGAGPLVLLNNKIVKCNNYEDFFNISSNRIYRRGNGVTAITCKFHKSLCMILFVIHHFYFSFVS